MIHTPPYLGFLFSQPILCRGYGRPSSPSVAGGGNTVDCVGDCTTGRGYCYARSYQGERICANCVLWDPVGSEVLCDFPQGGPIPGTPEWAEGVRLEQCANRTRLAAVSAWGRAAAELRERAALAERQSKGEHHQQ